MRLFYLLLEKKHREREREKERERERERCSRVVQFRLKSLSTLYSVHIHLLEEDLKKKKKRPLKYRPLHSHVSHDAVLFN